MTGTVEADRSAWGARDGAEAREGQCAAAFRAAPEPADGVPGTRRLDGGCGAGMAAAP